MTLAVPQTSASAPPGPDRQWLAAHARANGADPFRFLLDLTAEFGDTVHYQTLYGPAYFFNHPDQVRQVLHHTNAVRTPLVTLTLGQGLLSSDGPHWRAQRNVAQPAFHPACLAGFVPSIVAQTAKMMNDWDIAVGEQRDLDIAHEMKILTLNIIVQTMFSADWSERAETICEAVGVMVEDLGAIAGMLFNLPTLISPDRNARFRAALEVMDEAVYALIAARRADPNPPHDLLMRFLEARDATTGAPLSDVQLRDEVVTALIAGHETTAIALAWTFHLLGQNPDCAAQLHAEADAVLGDALPTLDDLPALTYTEMVFSEAMRLYPPVWMMVRKTALADEIGGFPIPAGASVIVSPYTTHRHPQLWPEPQRFNPQRFAPSSQSEKRPLYAYFPFAGGRHLCLGQRFATIEAQLILALLMARFEFAPRAHPPVVAQPALTLRHQWGVPVRARRRR